MNRWSYYMPNFLTLLRIMLTPIFIWLYLCSGYYIAFAVLVFTIAVISDFFDGYLARRFGICSKLGKFLDPLADKMLVLCALSTFAWQGLVPWWLVYLIMLRDIAITLLRIIMQRAGYQFMTSNLGKWKTAIQFIVIYAVLGAQIEQIIIASTVLHTLVPVLLYSAALITTISGCTYVYVNWYAIKRIVEHS